MSNNQRHYIRLMDGSPELITPWGEFGENIPRTIQIAIDTVSAGAFEESFFTCSNLSADRTRFTGILRVDENNLNSSFLGFVGEEFSKLVETPTTKQPIKSPTFSLFPYSFKVFHNNRTTCGESLNNLLTDSVVHIKHIKPLPSANLLQMSFSRLCAFALEGTPKPLHFVKGHTYALKESVVAGNYEVVYSEVNAEVVNRTVRNSLLNTNLFRDNHMQPHATLIITYQITTTNLPIQILPIILWENERKLSPTFERSETANTLLESNPITTSIIPNTKDWFELGFNLRLLKSLTDLRNTGNNQLRTQRTRLTNRLIHYMVQLKTIISNIPTNINNLISNLRILPTSIYENTVLRQPNLNRPIHTNTMYQTNIKEEGQFLPRLKSWVSLPNGL